MILLENPFEQQKKCDLKTSIKTLIATLIQSRQILLHSTKTLEQFALKRTASRRTLDERQVQHE
jgi:hypothetical protein